MVDQLGKHTMDAEGGQDTEADAKRSRVEDTSVDDAAVVVVSPRSVIANVKQTPAEAKVAKKAKQAKDAKDLRARKAARLKNLEFTVVNLFRENQQLREANSQLVVFASQHANSIVGLWGPEGSLPAQQQAMLVELDKQPHGRMRHNEAQQRLAQMLQQGRQPVPKAQLRASGDSSELSHV